MCQWCPALGKCSAAMHCPSATGSVCPEKNGPPSPASMSIDDPRNISLPVKHLPQPDGFVSSLRFLSGSRNDGVLSWMPLVDVAKYVVLGTPLGNDRFKKYSERI
ncbi:hypothetical protein ANCCAN_19980 [Ancylostoma caninum]|uniref:Uncharacterized protein n=1 Tax=Ancylostoma caninum TaxID=29170 RepID=A0A368FV93_ANCCA|nr:hypothetical protein ANCCAN_19980 [Ancylostoma caninum]